MKPELQANELLLEGPLGGDLLGFLCALGTSRLLEPLGVRMRWMRSQRGWSPVLAGMTDVETTLTHLEIKLAECRQDWTTVLGTGANQLEDIRMPLPEFRRRALATREMLAASQLLASVATDLSSKVDAKTKTDRCMASQLAFTPVAQTSWVGNVDTVLAQVERSKLRAALFSPWTYPDPAKSATFTWDPREFRDHALMAGNPSSPPTHERATTQLGAAILALAALPLFPTIGARNAVYTHAFRPKSRRPLHPVRVVWPIWLGALSAETSAAALAIQWEHEPQKRRISAGVAAVYEAPLLTRGKYRNFGLASEL